jgi:hypothetical protein
MGAPDGSKVFLPMLALLALAGCHDGHLSGFWPGPSDAPDADAATSADAADATDVTDTRTTADAPDASDRPRAADAADAPSEAAASAATCVITEPVVDATHPALNGVPIAQGGDRSSAAGAPYAVTFDVTTDLVDGETVDLDVDDVAAPTTITTLTAKAAGGTAVFTDVQLSSGETYEVRARCIDDNGVTSPSDPRTFPVDATPPDLVVSQPNGGEIIPPSGLTNGAFPVCGGTTSSDAVALAPALGARVANYCVAVGGSPTCAPATMTGTDVCIAVPCPGDAPFDVTVTLSDVAGNSTTQTLANVSCFSTLPSVRIVQPLSDAPGFSDVSKRLLAADAPQPLHDLVAGVDGAQTNVVACASRTGSIFLSAGLAGGGPLGVVGASTSTRAALPTDGCPAGFAFVVVFSNVTLPESVEAVDTSLLTPTQLRADLTDLSGAMNSSALVDLWVDSVDPSLVITSPPDICGSFHQSNDIFISSETVTSTAPDVMLELRNDMSIQTFDSMTFTAMTFPSVVFTQGATSLSGVVSDEAGNTSSLVPDPCVVTVGP